MNKFTLLLAMAAVNTACTSVDVAAVDPSLDIRHVCIEENPRVKVADFLDVLEDGLARHGLTSEVFSGGALPHCEYVLTYTALRSWDFAPYLAHAELVIWRHERKVAKATYHLVGGGGLSLMKWQGTMEKMAPVIDQLFEGRRVGYPATTTPRPVRARPDPTVAPMPALAPLPSKRDGGRIDPVVVPMPAARPAAKRETGFYGYHAGIVPEARSCAAAPAPVLMAKGGGAETYSIACDNGDVLTVRCEPGRCRALR